MKKTSSILSIIKSIRALALPVTALVFSCSIELPTGLNSDLPLEYQIQGAWTFETVNYRIDESAWVDQELPTATHYLDLQDEGRFQYWSHASNDPRPDDPTADTSGTGGTGGSGDGGDPAIMTTVYGSWEWRNDDSRLVLFIEGFGDQDSFYLDFSGDDGIDECGRYRDIITFENVSLNGSQLDFNMPLTSMNDCTEGDQVKAERIDSLELTEIYSDRLAVNVTAKAASEWEGASVIVVVQLFDSGGNSQMLITVGGVQDGEVSTTVYLDDELVTSTATIAAVMGADYDSHWTIEDNIDGFPIHTDGLLTTSTDGSTLDSSAASTFDSASPDINISVEGFITGDLFDLFASASP